MTCPPVVFDLDGTLIDSLRTMTNSANALLAHWHLPQIRSSQVAGYVGFGVDVFIDHLIADTGLPAQNRSALLERFMAIYVEQSKETVLFDGVFELLDWLKAKGTPLGLCTNKPSGPLGSVLETTGLGTYFDVVLAGDSLPRRKPAPEPLLECFKRLGGPGLYVGDSSVDAETAVAARVPFVLFTEGIRTVPVSELPHDWAVSNLMDIPAIYDTWRVGSA